VFERANLMRLLAKEGESLRRAREELAFALEANNELEAKARLGHSIIAQLRANVSAPRLRSDAATLSGPFASRPADWIPQRG